MNSTGMVLFGKINIVDYFPIMKYLPSVQSVKNQITQNRNMMFKYYKKVIDQHRCSFDKENIRDVIDFYLLELENSKENEPEFKLFEGVEEDEQIMQIIGDLFSAGMETIRTTLQWLVVYMVSYFMFHFIICVTTLQFHRLQLHNPSSIIAVQNELDKVVGRQRMVQTEDIKNLQITGISSTA